LFNKLTALVAGSLWLLNMQPFSTRLNNIIFSADLVVAFLAAEELQL